MHCFQTSAVFRCQNRAHGAAGSSADGVGRIYGESTLEKQEWKAQIKDQVKKILKSKPEAVYVQGDLFAVYPLIHALRKRHMPVLVMTEMEGEQKIVRIPSGS